MNKYPRVRALCVAGLDPSGGAGIIADLKTFSAFGGYGMAVITSITAQNTRGVTAVKMVDADMVLKQLLSISDDIKIDTLKIGLLGNVQNIALVCEWIKNNKIPYIVLDPVMVATSNDRLLNKNAEIKIIELAKLCDLITPNGQELSILLSNLLNKKITVAKTFNDALEQTKKLSNLLKTTVYLKGGHLKNNNNANDAVVYKNDYKIIESKFINTKNTHGTGCSLSSALAVIRPNVNSWIDAAKIAKLWLTNAIQNGNKLNIGKIAKNGNLMGHGPIDHLVNIL
jgi:hydroxymethylpyrimidine kinase/phosphomethylpyrimidine kinase